MSKTITDVEDATFAKRGHSEFVGCGTIECSIVRLKNTSIVQFRMRGKRISREKAERLIRSWNAARRPNGYYWTRAPGCNWDIYYWDGSTGGWLITRDDGRGPYSDEDVGEIGPYILSPSPKTPEQL